MAIRRFQLSLITPALAAFAVISSLPTPAQSQSIERWSTNLGVLQLDNKGNGNYSGTFNGNKLYGRKYNATQFLGSWINKKKDGLRCLYPIDGSYYWGRVKLDFRLNHFRGAIGVCDFPPVANWTGRRSGVAHTPLLSLKKYYKLRDREVISPDEYAFHQTDQFITVDRGKTYHFKRSEQSNIPRLCAGGEVSLEDWDRVEVDQNGVARLWIAMELYEGTSCSSGDLDGKYMEIDRRHNKIKSTPFMTVLPGQTSEKSKRVDNTDEGGDYGLIIYTLKNAVE